MTSYFTLLGWDPTCVIGTALTATCVTNTYASTLHVIRGNLVGNWAGAATMALAAGAGTWVSANYVALDMPPDDLRKILAASIGVAAVSMLRK